MIKIHGSPLYMRFRRISRAGAIALLSLFAIIGFAFVTVELAATRGQVHAAPATGKYDPSREIGCPAAHVKKGDDFRMAAYKKFDSEWPRETMKVWRNTHPTTADQTNYERLRQVRQPSTGSESKHGGMTSAFRARDGNFSEIDETFKCPA